MTRSFRLMAAAYFLSLFFVGSALGQIELQCLETPLPVECQTFAFDLDLTSVTDVFGILGPVGPGDILRGTFTTFTGFPDLDTDPENGRYLNAVECVRLDLGDREMVVVLEPTEISIPPSPSDPGVIVMNDTPSAAGPFTIFSDSATFLLGGPSAMLLDASSTELSFVGGGGFSFGYADACLSGIETPCPPTVLGDDSFPFASGDTAAIDTAQMTFDYLSLSGFSATASGDILAIDPSAPVPCPEPGFASAMMSGLLVLGLLGRRRIV